MSENPNNPQIPPDPEVPAKARRRQFSITEKLRIVEAADHCHLPGEVSALLRREGIYSSHLNHWRKLRNEGALFALKGRRRGRKANVKNPLEGRMKELEREKRRLER